MQQGPGSAAPAGWAPGIPGPSLPGWLPSSWGTFTVFAGTALLLNNQVLKIIFFHRIAQNSWGWKEAVGVTQSNPLAPAGPPREACLGTFVHLLKVVVYGLNTNFWILVILILLSLLSVWVFLMKKKMQIPFVCTHAEWWKNTRKPYQSGSIVLCPTFNISN